MLAFGIEDEAPARLDHDLEPLEARAQAREVVRVGPQGIQVMNVERETDSLVSGVAYEGDGVLESVVGEAVRVVCVAEHAANRSASRGRLASSFVRPRSARRRLLESRPQIPHPFFYHASNHGTEHQR